MSDQPCRMRELGNHLVPWKMLDRKWFIASRSMLLHGCFNMIKDLRPYFYKFLITLITWCMHKHPYTLILLDILKLAIFFHRFFSLRFPNFEPILVWMVFIKKTLFFSEKLTSVFCLSGTRRVWNWYALQTKFRSFFSRKD